MCRKPFDLRKPHDLGLDSRDRRSRVFDKARALEEMVHPEPVEAAGGSSGRQSVARAGQKVSGRDRRIVAQVDRPAVAHLSGRPSGLTNGEAQMFRRKLTGQIQGLSQVPGQDEERVFVQDRFDHASAGKGLQRFLDSRQHLLQ